MSKQQDAFDLVAHVAKSVGLIKVLGEDKTPEGVTRYENVQELLNGIKDFTEQQKELAEGDPSLANYLSDIALLTDRDNEVDDGTPKVSMMTIHLAKGLEFPVVIFPFAELNIYKEIEPKEWMPTAHLHEDFPFFLMNYNMKLFYCDP